MTGHTSKHHEVEVVSPTDYTNALHKMRTTVYNITEALNQLFDKPAVSLPAKRDLEALLSALAITAVRIERLCARVQKRRAAPLTEEEKRARRIERAKELLRQEAGIVI